MLKQTNRTRYDWLVDGQPSKLSFAEHGDVSGGIQVCVQPEPAFSASIIVPFPIALVDVPAVRAFLAREARVDIHDGLSESFGLIVDKLLKLAERPTPEHRVERMSEAFLALDTEGFEGNHIEGLVHDFFCDAVIHVGHKAFLLTGELLELSPGGRSPFGLERTAIVLISRLHASDVLAINEQVVGENGMVVDASIDPEHFATRIIDGSRSIGFCLHLDYQPAAVERDGRGLDFPVKIFVEVFRYFDGQLYPAADTGDGNNGLIAVERERPHVVPDCTVFSLDWQPPALLTLEHVGSAISGGCRERSGQAVLFPDWVVCGVMELELVSCFELEANVQNVVHGFVENHDGLDNSAVGFCVDGDCSFHGDTSLTFRVYKHLGEVSESINYDISSSTIPPRPEVRGILVEVIL